MTTQLKVHELDPNDRDYLSAEEDFAIRNVAIGLYLAWKDYCVVNQRYDDIVGMHQKLAMLDGKQVPEAYVAVGQLRYHLEQLIENNETNG